MRRAVACSVFAWLGGCAGGSSSSSPPSPGADVVADARLLRMTDLRQFDTTLVDALLHTADAARRARAVLAVGQVRGRSRYSEVRRMLVDADTAVAANAAFALGLAKDTASIVALARAVAGAPDPVAEAAAWALGDIGDAARSVLLLSLGEGLGQPLTASTASQRSSAVRAALITATAKLRATPTATLLPWLNDPHPVVARAAAYVLQRTRAPGGVRALIAVRASADDETRQHVARALARNIAGDSLGARALDALRVLATDSSARVRVNAVRAIATYGLQAREAVLKATRDTDGNVRVAAADLVAPYLGTDAAAWQLQWASDSTLPVRITLMSAARRAGTDALASAEDGWARSTDWRERIAVVRARIENAKPPRFADIRWALSDKDGRVREAAVNATRAMLGSEPSLADSVRTIWKGLLGDPDVVVRATVLSAMRAGANTAELPLVLDAYAHAASDRETDARTAAVAYVASAWQRDSAHFAPDLRDRVSRLGVPEDSAERAAGRAIGPLASWRVARTPTAARPLADYEAVIRRYVSPGARQLTAILHTERGDITLRLFGQDAPLTVDNFVQLARRGYYRNTQFHRVVPNFVAQDGDPRGDGTGGPGYAIRDELTRNFHTRGSLAMALSGPDTGGSQYYLTHSPQPHLDGHYTVFGQMTQGYDVLDRIVQGDRILSIEIR
jgi:cyclophilin family peptidyl-prolyl cis-trans isomerase/HEAT repeat protein